MNSDGSTPNLHIRHAGAGQEGHVAIIGCGNFAYSNIAYYLTKYQKGVIRAAMDKEIARAASLCRAYNAGYYTNSVSDIANDKHVDLVYIASNHASHAEYAISMIEAGKNVHIEKPHVVTRDQLRRLTEAMRNHPDVKVFLGFNRPKSRLFSKLSEFVLRESGPAMINWFVAGHEIPDDHWYFHPAEGGRVLGNLCHWTDLTLHLVGLENAFPCRVVPLSPPNSRSDFVVSLLFADNSCASITFSAKGHTFEGVREVLNLHKGNLIATLTDFGSLSLDLGPNKYAKRLLFRDHGHRNGIVNSLVAGSGEHISYVSSTAELFLTIRETLETGKSMTVQPS